VIVFETKFVLGAALAASALALVACDSSSGSRGAAPLAEAKSDQAGEEPLAGVVRIKSVTRAPDGGVRYVLENISGKDQEDLSYFISFLFPSQVGTAITMLGDREATPQRDLVLLRGTEKELAAGNPRPGTASQGTRIDVFSNEAVPVVARSAGEPGTLFFNKTIECVAMAPEDDQRGANPRLWIEFENVSANSITDIEAKVQFHDPSAGNRKVGETNWTPLSNLSPHQRARIDFDLSGVGRISNRIFLVKIRQQAL
jgi:hypothetical protein